MDAERSVAQSINSERLSQRQKRSAGNGNAVLALARRGACTRLLSCQLMTKTKESRRGRGRETTKSVASSCNQMFAIFALEGHP